MSSICFAKSTGIKHRLTTPKHPETNGMVERFNGRLAQVLKSHRFNSAHNLETTLHRFVSLCNENSPQRALDLNTPIQALKKCAPRMSIYPPSGWSITRGLTCTLPTA